MASRLGATVTEAYSSTNAVMAASITPSKLGGVAASASSSANKIASKEPLQSLLLQTKDPELAKLYRIIELTEKYSTSKQTLDSEMTIEKEQEIQSDNNESLY